MERWLFLDDMEARHSSFMSRAVGLAIVVQVRTAAEAIRALDSCGPFDKAFLDHDLSERDIMILPGQPSHVPTGMTVARHICAMANPPAQVIVHSLNPPAAKAMVALLQGANVNAKELQFTELLPALIRARSF